MGASTSTGGAGRLVVGLEQIDRSQVGWVGGKAANLGELTRIEGTAVPPGFCATTDAFAAAMAATPAFADALARLVAWPVDDLQGIAEPAAALRSIVGSAAIPTEVAAAIRGAAEAIGAAGPWAVRSSATAEDLPTASFAGQQDTYLNVVGLDAILDHVRRCWASLFTDRAVAYRLHQGIDHRSVQMAVVVQRLVAAEASGILFTADPASGHRQVAVVEASYGLGEALVAGLVDPDTWAVRSGEVVARTVGSKQLAVEPVPAGGTTEVAVDAARQHQAVLSDAQVVELVALGRRVEARLGGPQDVEWCLGADGFHLVQSRPITTLFPIPAADGPGNRVYVSVGHQQMMTDPIRPLGISFWQMTAPRPMHEAGGRLFVEVADTLASPATRGGLLAALGRSDPLIGDALQALIDRDGFLVPPAEGAPAARPPGGSAVPGAPPLPTDPSIVIDLIAEREASVEQLRQAIGERTGTALLEFIREDVDEMRRGLFGPRSIQVVMAGMEAAWWLNEHVAEWLGERNVADTLSQSVPHNVTSEMGLALLDVADAIRPHPEVVALLQATADDGFLDQLDPLPGGTEARAAIEGFLDRYGMRCVGEIDITRPRWHEQPTALLPVILGHVATFGPGAARRRFEEGRAEAEAAAKAIVERLRALPDGEGRAAEAQDAIDRLRAFAGYREYPKYFMICRYAIYRRALMAEAGRLVAAGVLDEVDDIAYLRFEELAGVVQDQAADRRLIAGRKEAHRAVAALAPPRVLTSDGEVVTGRYRRDGLPEGALVGLPVSVGTVEGRARVVLDMAHADLQPGDILVTRFTDPSWTPVFVSIAGLVTEVGGLMTHGAVIAREYGLPAVVGVEHATERITDGQQIRVHGTDGYVELLS